MSLSVTIGCQQSTEPRPEHKIITSLGSRNRNEVHVTLWTLEQNEISVPEGILIDGAYQDSKLYLHELAIDLANLNETRLTELDESLAYHRKIFSPIWGPDRDKWD
jgi:hypothetical protein